jgi:hypothetical protein
VAADGASFAAGAAARGALPAAVLADEAAAARALAQLASEGASAPDEGAADGGGTSAVA